MWEGREETPPLKCGDLHGNVGHWCSITTMSLGGNIGFNIDVVCMKLVKAEIPWKWFACAYNRLRKVT